MTFETFPDAQPLDPEEYAELNANEDWKHLITEIDGKFYSEDDLYRCDNCDDTFTEHALLNDDGHCALCAADLAAEAKHQQQERPW